MRTADDPGPTFEQDFDDHVATLGGTATPILPSATRGAQPRSADRLVTLGGDRFLVELKVLGDEAYQAEVQTRCVELAERLKRVALPFKFDLQFILRRGPVPGLQGRTVFQFWDASRQKRFVAAVQRRLRELRDEQAVRILALFDRDDFELEVVPGESWSADASDRGSLQLVVQRDPQLNSMEPRSSHRWELNPEPHLDLTQDRLRTAINPASDQLRQSLIALGEQVPALVIVRPWGPKPTIDVLKVACHGPWVTEFPIAEQGHLDVSRAYHTHHWTEGFFPPPHPTQRGRDHVSALVTLHHVENGVGIVLHNPTASCPCAPELLIRLAPKIEQYAWVPPGGDMRATIRGLRVVTPGSCADLLPWNRAAVEALRENGASRV